MTKVLKLLGGGMLAAVLGAMLFANVAFAESPPNPPARFVGSVLVDGQAPAGGTLIEARIGSATCGATTVFMAGSEARYVVDSPALDPGANPNCGVDGAVVTFYIGGKKANETGSWKNYQLNTVNLTYTTPTTTATATPKPPVTGTTGPATDSSSATWLYAVLGLGALAFGVGGATVARRAR
ncbi:MAG: hypothetical protein U0837_07780 [Dehalococcoidia bacterium]